MNVMTSLQKIEKTSKHNLQNRINMVLFDRFIRHCLLVEVDSCCLLLQLHRHTQMFPRPQDAPALQLHNIHRIPNLPGAAQQREVDERKR
jgi:hypothetical protein